MLNDRRFAWIVTAVVMVVGVFLGNTISYFQHRRPVTAQFQEEVVPLLRETMQLVHNMETIYNLNTPEGRESHLESHPVEDLEFLLRLASQLNEASRQLQLNEQDARLMRNLYMDVNEMQMIIRQSTYNNMVRELNETARSGLGFFIHDWSPPQIIE